MVVPGGLVQQEDVPVGEDEHQTTQTVQQAQHDPHSTWARREENIHLSAMIHFTLTLRKLEISIYIHM